MNCKECGLELQSGKELVIHLVEKHNYTLEDIYKYFNYSFETGEATCPICGTPFKISSKQKWKHNKGIGKGIGCCLRCSKILLLVFQKSPFTRPEVREKAKESLKKRRVVKSNEKKNVKHGAQSAEVQEKMKRTNLERYGVENASQSEEIKKKRRETMLKRYGVEHVSQVKKFRDRAQEALERTNLNKYGVKYPAQNSEVLEKMKRTNLERYGVEYSVESEDTKQKARETNLEKYGVENAFLSPEVREKAKQSNLKRYGVQYASQSDEVKDRIKKTNLEKYGVEYFCQHEKCSSENGFRISKENKKFQALLESKSIDSTLEFTIGNYGYDLKVGNCLVEINPYFTHNSTRGPYFGKKERDPKPSDYHLKKTMFAREKGYSCVHVFDWDNLEKLLLLFQNKKVIYARDCEVKELKRSITNEFLGNYHLQGNTRTFTYSYGLFNKGKLVQVMTFGKPRYNKKCEYELLRLCTAPELKVTGGASKILKYFEGIVKPKSIVSYCDLSKFNGNVYEKLGFKLESQTQPARHWYNPKSKRHITDNLLRQRGFDQLHNTTFGKGTSNEELMIEHGYVEIYDCGQLVFTKHNFN